MISSSFFLFAMEIQDSRGGKKQNSQNASEHDYLAGSGSYIKVQGTRNWNAQQTCKCVQFNRTSIILYH